MTQRFSDLFTDDEPRTTAPSHSEQKAGEQKAAEGQQAGSQRRDVADAVALLRRSVDFLPTVTPSGPAAPFALALAALALAYNETPEAGGRAANTHATTSVGLYSTLLTSLEVKSFNREEELSSSSLIASRATQPFFLPPKDEWAVSFSGGEEGFGPLQARGAGATEAVSPFANGVNGGACEATSPVPDVAAAFRQGPSYRPPETKFRPFRLKPPEPPKGARVPEARDKKGHLIPSEAIVTMYALCYGADNAEKWRAITKEETFRVIRALRAIADSGGDLSRLGEYVTWYRSWATQQTVKPEYVRGSWWKAMAEIEARIPAAKRRPGAAMETQDFNSAVRAMQQAALNELGVKEDDPRW